MAAPFQIAIINKKKVITFLWIIYVLQIGELPQEHDKDTKNMIFIEVCL